MKQPKQRSTTGGQNRFAQVPNTTIQRSSFDRSCGLKTTFDSGWLIPMFQDEVLPGDTFSLKLATFARMATPVHPVMDNMWMDTFFFFVPNRLLWNKWEKFCGAQDNPDDSTDFLVPTITSGAGIPANHLFDYMGLPAGTGTSITFNALYPRAYNKIWTEWFRDENLQDSLTVTDNDGPDNFSFYNTQKRGKRHDFFTSCLPFPQKGEAVQLPLGSTAPIVQDPASPDLTYDLGGAIRTLQSNTGDGELARWNADVSGGDNTARYDGGLLADLSDATAATINEIREAFQIQRMLERDARGGTRYVELLKSHFGVTSPDFRLQRSEYLGGGSTMININPVAQTSQTDDSGSDASAQGNLAAIGTASSTTHGFTKSFTEHGVIIGLVSVRADLNYQQGLSRDWSRQTRFDFFWPSLAQIGEQAILNQEIYFQGGGAEEDEMVFGYQERYAEYRYKPSQITGQMRSNFAQSLDNWHLAQDFSSLPVLGDDFIREDPPIDRVIAVPSEPHWLFDAYFQYHCARPMPLYGVPGNMDRF